MAGGRAAHGSNGGVDVMSEVMDSGGHETHSSLRYRTLGIDTQQEYVIYMRRDCHVCRAEGF